jgi:deazaflavin-dependent oxidoreductase (nitroreductase family)
MQKQFFKFVMSIFVGLYRMTSGRIGGSMQGLGVLLLTTTGRKSGKQWTTPLGYFEDNGAYIITASNAGADRDPSWFFNLKSNPIVNIQVKDKQITAIAEPADSEKRNQLWDRLVTIAPGYKNYEKQTSRVIPMVILKPKQSN